MNSMLLPDRQPESTQARSRPLRTGIALRAACTALAALMGAGAIAQGAGSLPTVELSAGIHLIHAELANNELSRVRGLMNRPVLEPNHGMLFVFDDSGQHCMWMRNTLVPLSVAFIRDDGSIVNIEEMKPQTDDSHCAGQPTRYALEMSGEWFSRHGIRPGSVIKGVSQATPAH
jgi:uncharacterized membrane protein (UPF0127 family)